MITKSFPVGVASECIDEAMEYEAQSYLIETWDEGQQTSFKLDIYLELRACQTSCKKWCDDQWKLMDRLNKWRWVIVKS